MENEKPTRNNLKPEYLESGHNSKLHLKKFRYNSVGCFLLLPMLTYLGGSKCELLCFTANWDS
jgi:hypothetical protein